MIPYPEKKKKEKKKRFQKTALCDITDVAKSIEVKAGLFSFLGLYILWTQIKSSLHWMSQGIFHFKLKLLPFATLLQPSIRM